MAEGGLAGAVPPVRLRWPEEFVSFSANGIFQVGRKGAALCTRHFRHIGMHIRLNVAKAETFHCELGVTTYDEK